MNVRWWGWAGAGASLAAGVALLLLSGGTPFATLPTSPTVGLGDVSLEDLDEDGVADALEVYRHGTDPRNVDTDGDGMPDGFEAAHRLDPLDANDANEDPDGDGLTNLQESRAGAPADFDLVQDGAWRKPTDPRKADTDDDQLPDGWEVRYGFDPLAGEDPDADPDADGLPNLIEAEHFADPLARDGDADGLADPDEVRQHGTDPASLDTDGDGMPDGFEVQNGLDPTDPNDANEDPDGDGLTNLEESRAGAPADYHLIVDGPWRKPSDPDDPDTDADGVPDGFEVRAGLDPLDPADGRLDGDADGLTNLEESRAGAPADFELVEDGVWPWPTDPASGDTDGDGLLDGEEVAGYPVTIAGETRSARSSPLLADSDADGLADVEERDIGTNATNRDTDFDGLADGLEFEVNLDPLNPDTDGDGLADGTEFDLWTGRQTGALAALAAGDDAPLGQLRKVSPEHARLSDAELADLLSPLGNVDFHADDLANVLDEDSDQDGLTDGEELNPDGFLAPLSVSRPPTDPAARDTDGDDLADRWEVDNTAVSLANLTLDPTRSDSDSNGVTDDDEDFDSDGVVPFSPSLGGPGPYAAFTNLLEQEWGTHPHRSDSDGDGLRDGFEGYFSDLHGGSGTTPLDPTRTDTDGDGTPDPEEDFDADGVTLWDAATRRCQAPVPFDNALEQEAGTDPFLVDTDGDLMADSFEAAYDLDPMNPADASIDSDADGVVIGGALRAFTNLLEFQVRETQKDAAGKSCPTDPRVPDTDQGGLTDGFEVIGLGDSPLAGPDALGEDPDGDELSNELEVFHGTSPSSPDTDADGMTDGAEVLGTARLCGRRVVADPSPTARIRGSDPTRFDTDGDGMPDAWEVCHGVSPRDDQTRPGDADSLSDGEEYRWGRPAGSLDSDVWWGGLDPSDEDTDDDGVLDGKLPRADVDEDNDGLHDLNGEDPRPFNDHNDTGTPDFDPFGGGKSKSPAIRSKTKDFAAGGPPDRVARAPTRLVLTNPPQTVELGDPLVITGRLEVTGQAGGNLPAPNVPVLLAIRRAWVADEVAAIAVTGADGSFELKAERASRAATLPTGVELFGSTSPLAAGLSALRAGPQSFVVWSVNTSATVASGHPQYGTYTTQLPGGAQATVHAVRATVHRFSTTVATPVEIAVDTPDRRPVERTLALAGRLVDVLGGQVPVDADVEVVAFQGRANEETRTVAAVNGTFSAAFSTAGLPPGTYPFQLAFTPQPGASHFEASSRLWRVTLYEEPRLAVEPLALPETAPGGTVEVIGTLSASAGPIVAGALNLTLDGERVLSTTTASDGAFAFALELPLDVEPGPKLLVVEYAGGPGALRPLLYTINRTSVFVEPTLRVLRSVNFTVDAPTDVRTDALDVPVRLHLSDDLGEPVTDCALAITLQGLAPRLASCDADGEAFVRLALPKELRPGPRALTAQYPGSGGLAPASVTQLIAFRGATLLTLAPARGNASLPLQVSGSLTLVDGGAEVGRTVAIALDATPLGTAATLADGSFVLSAPAPPGLAPGTHRLTASHPGSLLTLPAEPATTELQFRHATRVRLETVTLVRGPNLVAGALVARDGTGIVGKVVFLELPWTRLATVTLQGGVFERIVTVPSDVPVGPAAATATFPGDDGFERSSRAVELRILGPARLLVDEVASVRPGGSLAVIGRLLDEADAPVSDGRLALSSGPASAAASPATDGSFRLTLPLPDGIGPGHHRAHLNLTASTSVHDTGVTVLFLVTRTTQLELTIDRDALSEGQPFTVLASLTDDADQPVANSPLIVTLAYAGRNVDLATSTGADGRAVLRVPYEDGMQVTARYPGQAGFTASTASATPVPPVLTAKEAGSALLAVALGALAILGAVALVAWYRTRTARRVRGILAQALSSLMAGDEYTAVILLAYRRLEEIVGMAGVRVLPQDTARDFRERALSHLPLPEPELDSLVGLFEATRYGGRLPTGADRNTAISSLRRVIQSLDQLIIGGPA